MKTSSERSLREKRYKSEAKASLRDDSCGSAGNRVLGVHRDGPVKDRQP